MGEVVSGQPKIAREAGWLYYVDKDGWVSKAKMVHHGRVKKCENV
jgi:hypothetical protein